MSSAKVTILSVIDGLLLYLRSQRGFKRFELFLALLFELDTLGLVTWLGEMQCLKQKVSGALLLLLHLGWLFKYLKANSIHLSFWSLLAVTYLKVVEAQYHQTILSYRTFGIKESYNFFATEHLVVNNVKKFPILVPFFHSLTYFDPVLMSNRSNHAQSH